MDGSVGMAFIMMWVLIIIVVAGLILAVLYLGMTAGRLDRLHQRVDTSLLTLQAHLARRAAITLEVAGSGLVDPATSVVLAEEAHATLAAADQGDVIAWQEAESELTQALVVAFDEPLEVDDGALALLEELKRSCRRVELSRRFHNDAVRACRQIRSRTLVRAFRLAGHTPLPSTWEMADEVPIGLG